MQLHCSNFVNRGHNNKLIGSSYVDECAYGHCQCTAEIMSASRPSLLYFNSVFSSFLVASCCLVAGPFAQGLCIGVKCHGSGGGGENLLPVYSMLLQYPI